MSGDPMHRLLCEAPEPKRQLRKHDHRLVQLVQKMRAPSIPTRLGVTGPWWRPGFGERPRSVTTTADGDASLIELRAGVARLEWRNQRLTAVQRKLFASCGPSIRTSRACGDSNSSSVPDRAPVAIGFPATKIAPTSE